MTLKEITNVLEAWAPLSYQEAYDNSGLIVGHSDAVSSALVSLDCTEAVVQEAISLGANLIISHHPIIFSGVKKLNNTTNAQRAIALAIKHNIALYAIHTNLDNVSTGVNAEICERLNLRNTKILAPKTDLLKIVIFVPKAHTEAVRNAIFEAGAGHIGTYSHCSFLAEGQGSFMPLDGSNPYVGAQNKIHAENEDRLETVVSEKDIQQVIAAIHAAHPYETPAYDILKLQNQNHSIGSGMVGTLAAPVSVTDFLQRIKNQFNTSVIKHTLPHTATIQKVAVCGGAGGFLLPQAIAAGADIFITSDYKYHEFFDAEGKIIIADIGHFESEQYTIDLIIKYLTKTMPTLKAHATAINTNPVRYFV